MDTPANLLIDLPAFSATRLLFRDDAYADGVEAEVIGIHRGTIVLDQTLFYAASGGQPSDFGTLARVGHSPVAISDSRYLDPGKTIIGHVLPENEVPEEWLGARVSLALDRNRRQRLMRMHSALHLLSVVLPYSVTGGAIGIEDGRLDFDIPEAGLDKDEITEKLNELIERSANIRDRWITEEELDANPRLVKTMSVKPPRGTGQVRLVEIDGLDLQPCGGTHVRNTREIGRMNVTSIEKKGKQNRRVRIAFA